MLKLSLGQIFFLTNLSNVDRFPVVGDETRIEFRFSRFEDFVQTRARHRLRAEPAGRQDR